jgi:Ni,Fe-hydrogenase maturation factor
VAIGIQPDRVELSTELSAVVRDSVDSLVAHIIQRLEQWGHRARPITGDA